MLVLLLRPGMASQPLSIVPFRRGTLQVPVQAVIREEVRRKTQFRWTSSTRIGLGEAAAARWFIVSPLETQTSLGESF